MTMRLLLDTHIFLWAIKNDRRLSKTTRMKILNATDVFISSASIWEAVIKTKLKKLDADIEQIVESISESGFIELPITTNHAKAVSRLPDIHRDPFDRLLIGQAIVEKMTFVSKDSLFEPYQVSAGLQVIW